MTDHSAALRVRGLSKRFGAVKALRDVDLDVAAGEVHGLLGANGSGKSTLIKILAGYHVPDEGAISVGGHDLRLPVPSLSKYGLGVIHQDLGLADRMTVFENLGVTDGYGRAALSPIRVRTTRTIYGRLLDELGIGVSLDDLIVDLNPAERALVAIARALHVCRAAPMSGQPVLVLDEPTAYLPGPDAQRVTTLARSVARSGAAVLFVSHRLAEVLATTDRFTVLCDGRVAAHGSTADTEEAAIIRAMLGRDLAASYPPRSPAGSGPPRLVVRGLCAARLHDVDLVARGGEILGVTGLAGMGQDELARAIAGDLPVSRGQVQIDGIDVTGKHPRHVVEAGAVLIPGDRHRDGVWLSGTAQENVTLPVLPRYFRGGLLSRSAERRSAQQAMQQYSVHPNRPFAPVSQFSGGNQQKLVLAKWLQTDPGVLLLNEPTQGVDAGARSEILSIVNEHAAAGAAVVIFSGDHEQLAAICHRVLVLRHGRIETELQGAQVTEGSLVAAVQRQ